MTDRPTFTMLVGIPGSGKSTFAKTVKARHISSDAIRKELWGDESCQNNPDLVFKVMHERTLEALQEGHNVVYDATSITRKSRKSILDKLPAHVIKECIIVWAPINVCIERDASRDRTVGEAVIDKMLRRFEAPFYDEGFDFIGVYITAEHHDEDSYFGEIFNNLHISHDNPHHSADVYEHCVLCGESLLEKDIPEVIKTAGFLHDIGKPYTKTFVDKKGETSEIAHYYDHQAVGAWISYGFSENNITLAWLISSHMAPFINQKYYNSLDPFYKKWIDVLHEADKNSH